jgi:caffeoyl-CoA O-methyltransferase
MLKLDENVSDYIEKYSTQEAETLMKIARDTHLYQINPRMLSGHIQGKFLEMISCMISPKRILEIGTFTMYSTICLAKGLAKNGKIITIEKNPELEKFYIDYLTLSGIANKTEYHIGNAVDIIPSIEEEFDLIFIDADKENYPIYLDLVLPKLKINGFIIADNVLWDGKVLQPVQYNDINTAGIVRFNKMVAESTKLENVILPIRDGLSIIRKVSD